MLELRQEMTYDQVTQELAAKLGMPDPVAGAQLLRLTQHSPYTHAPQRQPLKWRQATNLQGILTQGSNLNLAGVRHHSGAHNVNDVLYYEILDMPLEQLEQLKTLKVFFHKESGEVASEHSVRLKKDAEVMELLREVAAQLGPGYEDKPLRLLETHSSKPYKLYSANDSVDTLDDAYWRLRVEVVPPDENGLELVPSPMSGEHLLRCCHILPDKSTSPVLAPVQGPTMLPAPATHAPGPMDITAPLAPAPQGIQGPGSPVGGVPGVQGLGSLAGAPIQGPLFPTGSFTGGGGLFSSLQPYGDPLLVKCGPTDTLATIKARLQAKLGLSDEELSKWRWAFCSPKGGIEPLLSDADAVGGRVPRIHHITGTLGDAPYLAMVHEDDKPRRPAANNSHRPTFERAVKIYS